MAMSERKWWENRVLRSVDNLKLWDENPRLDPTSKLVTLRDFAEELLGDSNDEKDFLNLLKSIATRGFMTFDPVVVWQDKESKNFIVAEGNRRVLALKLLRSPEKAPLSIRKAVVNLSRSIDRDEIEKVKVTLAPSYEEARWYILQRHSVASHQVRWQRLQQQRFIINVYDSVGQDIDETINITGFKRSTIVDALRFVKIRDIATRHEIVSYLTTEEREKVYSHKINMTVLERWFGNGRVREAWHIEFDENGVTINADPASFYRAYASLLKLMLTKNHELGFLVNTRTIDSNFQKIFEMIPAVKSKDEQQDETSLTLTKEGNDIAPLQKPETESYGSNDVTDGVDGTIKEGTQNNGANLKGNPKRGQLTDRYHSITTKNYKLKELFKELQKLPIKRYSNVAASSIRIFLELAIDDFIDANELREEIQKNLRKGYHEISLIQKLNFLKNEFIDDREANKVINELLNMSNEYSLNTLNEYVHGSKVHKVEPQFLNRFWDMLSPLFGVLINLKEV